MIFWMLVLAPGGLGGLKGDGVSVVPDPPFRGQW